MYLINTIEKRGDPSSLSDTLLRVTGVVVRHSEVRITALVLRNLSICPCHPRMSINCPSRNLLSGIQAIFLNTLESRFRGNDNKNHGNDVKETLYSQSTLPQLFCHSERKRRISVFYLFIIVGGRFMFYLHLLCTQRCKKRRPFVAGMMLLRVTGDGWRPFIRKIAPSG